MDKASSFRFGSADVERYGWVAYFADVSKTFIKCAPIATHYSLYTITPLCPSVFVVITSSCNEWMYTA